MTPHAARSRARKPSFAINWSRAGVGAVLAALVACQADTPTATRVAQAPAFAKGRAGGTGGHGNGSGGPAVTAASPADAHRDTTLSVTVTGSGFTAGAHASWSLDGDTTRVHVNSTTVVSSTQLVANITVPSAAPLRFYSVLVTNSDGKQGVGADLFEVTTAVIVGSGIEDPNNLDMSEQLQVSGYTGSSSPFFFDDATGLQGLGTGQAWAIDPLGTMVLGRSSGPTAWVRRPDGTFVAEILPNSGGGGNVAAAAHAPDGTLVVGGWDVTPALRKNGSGSVTRPAVWVRVGTGWSSPTILPFPGTSATLRGLNGSGLEGGMTTLADGSQHAIVWENASYTLLDGDEVQQVNTAGTIAVGIRNGNAAFWWRNPATGQWSAGVTLPALGGTCGGQARDINDAGIIVGQACNASGVVQAAVWRLDTSVSPPRVASTDGLTGLGVKGSSGTTVSYGAAITNSAPYSVAGSAQASGSHRLAVRWRLP